MDLHNKHIAKDFLKMQLMRKIILFTRRMHSQHLAKQVKPQLAIS